MVLRIYFSPRSLCSSSALCCGPRPMAIGDRAAAAVRPSKLPLYVAGRQHFEWNNWHVITSAALLIWEETRTETLTIIAVLSVPQIFWFSCFTLETMKSFLHFHKQHSWSKSVYPESSAERIFFFLLSSSKSNSKYISSLGNNCPDRPQHFSSHPVLSLPTVSATPEYICQVWRYLLFADQWWWDQALELLIDIHFLLLYFPHSIYFKCTGTTSNVNVNEW